MDVKEISKKVGKSVGDAAAVSAVAFLGSLALSLVASVGKKIQTGYRKYLDT